MRASVLFPRLLSGTLGSRLSVCKRLLCRGPGQTRRRTGYPPPDGPKACVGGAAQLRRSCAARNGVPRPCGPTRAKDLREALVLKATLGTGALKIVGGFLPKRPSVLGGERDTPCGLISRTCRLRP